MTFKRTEFSSLKFVGMLIAALCLSSCQTVSYPASQAQPIPDIGKVRRDGFPQDGYPLRLKLSGLEVDVLALNLASPSWPTSGLWRASRTGTQLLVLLVLSPKTDGVRFDPSRVRYQPEYERPGHPSLVQGPARKTWVGGRFNTCSSSPKYPDAYARITGSMLVTERACFRIFFDDDRTEHRAFTLFIEGISTSGKPLAVPPVVFKHKVWTQRERHRNTDDWRRIHPEHS